MITNEFKSYLETEILNKCQEKINSLRDYGSTISLNNSMYLVDDIMNLLGVKSIWHKINNLIEEQDKVNRTISVNGVSRLRTLITKKGTCKIIASMRKKPHDIICKFFGYIESNNAVIDTIDTSDNYNFEAGPNNFYIKRLKHIFSSQRMETFFKINIGPSQHVILDVFFPDKGIVILFNKKPHIFAVENVFCYIAAQSEILKKYIRLNELKWIQFTTYDSKSVTQFDELLKDLFNLFIHN